MGAMSVVDACGYNSEANTVKMEEDKSKECATEIGKLLKTQSEVSELRDEYKKLKKAYTPLNLLMERARQIPMESVWPARGHTEMQTSIKDLVDKRVKEVLAEHVQNAHA